MVTEDDTACHRFLRHHGIFVRALFPVLFGSCSLMSWHLAWAWWPGAIFLLVLSFFLLLAEQIMVRSRRPRAVKAGETTSLLPEQIISVHTGQTGATKDSTSHHSGHDEEAMEAGEMQGLLASYSALTIGHDVVRDKIDAAKNAQDCINIYKSDAFRECLTVLGESRRRYYEKHKGTICFNAMTDAWAKSWAEAMCQGKDWALLLEKCRNTAFRLLRKVCDLWNDEGRQANSRVLEKFEKSRIQQILKHTLVMDRYNALQYMEDGKNVSDTDRGLCWYSVYDDGQNGAREMVSMPRNPQKPALNKRYIWLYYQYDSYQDDPAITKWLQIAFPARLKTPEKMKDKAFIKQLWKAREVKFKNECKSIGGVQQQKSNERTTKLVYVETSTNSPPPRVSNDTTSITSSSKKREIKVEDDSNDSIAIA